MPDPKSSHPDTDYQLLFGVLALQLELIDAPQFADACAGWATRKQVPLAELLVERGWLTADDRHEVQRLLERKLKKHGGDARKSLGVVADGSVRDIIRSVDAPELVMALSGLPRQRATFS
jgi:eukaryotic-like serine/threonine-protein kinase